MFLITFLNPFYCNTFMISDDVKRIDLLFVKEFPRYTNVEINK